MEIIYTKAPYDAQARHIGGFVMKSSVGLDDGVLLCKLYDLIDVAKGETRHGVCTAIVDGDTPCLCIM